MSLPVVPFEMEIWGGLGRLKGLLRVEAGALIIEYRKIFLNMVPSGGIESVTIPAQQVRACRLKERWFDTKLEIVTASMAPWGRFPSDKPGFALMELAKDDRDEARRLVELFAAKAEGIPDDFLS